MYARRAQLLKVLAVVIVVCIVSFDIYVLCIYATTLFSLAKSLKAKLIIIIKVYQN